MNLRAFAYESYEEKQRHENWNPCLDFIHKVLYEAGVNIVNSQKLPAIQPIFSGKTPGAKVVFVARGS